MEISAQEFGALSRVRQERAFLSDLGRVLAPLYRQRIVGDLASFQASRQHGILVVWSDTSVPTGYTADTNATIGHIAAGALQPSNGPLNSLIFPKRMLAQVRIRPKFFATWPPGFPLIASWWKPTHPTFHHRAFGERRTGPETLD